MLAVWLLQTAFDVLLLYGGNATSPIVSMFGSMIPSRVWTPSFALSRSVHSPLGPVGVHIDPVRSTTSMMSTGAEEHG